VIYIPTKGRIDKQKTWDRMPPEIQAQTVLVCPNEEFEEHERRGRAAVVCHETGIAATRDWIIEDAIVRGDPYVLMLDDDMIFQRRRADGKITNCTDEEVSQAVGWVWETLPRYAHVALATRFLGYADEAEYVENGRAMYALGYDARVLIDNECSFCEGMPQPSTMEDFNMTLQLLTKGYPNCISLEWRITPGQSNAPGGCSTWRTTDIQTRSARALQARFPHLVTLREKKEWRDMEEGMLDVRVKWKGAINV
jgi:hypothetical protein